LQDKAAYLMKMLSDAASKQGLSVKAVLGSAGFVTSNASTSASSASGMSGMSGVAKKISWTDPRGMSDVGNLEDVARGCVLS
jgi:hypothetical protein